VIAPLSASSPFRPARPSNWRVITRCITWSTGASSCVARAAAIAAGWAEKAPAGAPAHGGASPGTRSPGHCFVPGERPGGIARLRSTKWAPVCAIRQAPHDGQNQRRLQPKAISLPRLQSPQRKRKKPWATIPQSRKVSNSAWQAAPGRWPGSSPGANSPLDCLCPNLAARLDKLWRVAAGGRLYPGDEGRSVLLQAVQHGLFPVV
jgi:hypothetical protein